MANSSRIHVVLDKAAVGKFLKSAELQRVVRDVADDIAKETEARYRADGKDYKFETFSKPTNQRARAIAGSKDGDHVRYSEAARGHLLDEANKKRDI